MRGAGRRRLPAVCLVSVCLLGCGGTRAPIELDPDFAATRWSSVALPPIVDVRADRFEQVRVVAQTRDAAERLLRAKGYQVTTVALPDELRALSAAQLREGDPGLLASAFAEQPPPVLLLFLERLEHGGESPGESSVTISALLLDPAAQKVVWKDRSVGHSSFGGLFTILSGPSTEYEAVYEALRGVLRTLPDVAEAVGDRAPVEAREP